MLLNISTIRIEVSVVAVLMISVFPVSLMADCPKKEGVRERVYPLTVSIEMERKKRVRVPMAFKMCSEKYGISLGELKNKKNIGEYEQFLVKLIEQIRTKDKEALENMSRAQTRKGLLKNSEKIRFGIHVSVKYISDHLDSARVLSKLYYGNDRIFMVSIDEPNSDQKAIIPYRIRRVDDEIYWIGVHGPSVPMLIKESHRRLTTRGKRDGRMTKYRNKKYQFEELLYGSGTKFPVKIYFDGRALSGFNILRPEDQKKFDKLKQKHPALGFFHKTINIFVDQKFQTYKEYLTPESRNTFQSELDEFGTGYFNRVANEIKESGRYVHFIIDADRLQFIFYSKSPGYTNTLFVKTVFQPTSGRFRIASRGYKSVLKQVLSDEQLFLNPILRPLISEENKRNKERIKNESE